MPSTFVPDGLGPAAPAGLFYLPMLFEYALNVVISVDGQTVLGFRLMSKLFGP